MRDRYPLEVEQAITDALRRYGDWLRRHDGPPFERWYWIEAQMRVVTGADNHTLAGAMRYIRQAYTWQRPVTTPQTPRDAPRGPALRAAVDLAAEDSA